MGAGSVEKLAPASWAATVGGEVNGEASTARTPLSSPVPRATTLAMPSPVRSPETKGSSNSSLATSSSAS